MLRDRTQAPTLIAGALARTKSKVVAHLPGIFERLNEPGRIYVGWTKDLRQRLKEHNWGMSPYLPATVRGGSFGMVGFQVRRRREILGVT